MCRKGIRCASSLSIGVEIVALVALPCAWEQREAVGRGGRGRHAVAAKKTCKKHQSTPRPRREVQKKKVVPVVVMTPGRSRPRDAQLGDAAELDCTRVTERQVTARLVTGPTVMWRT